MPLNVLLYISLSFFILGLLYKGSTWFRRSIGLLSNDTKPFLRFFSFLKSFFKVFFSKKILKLIACFLLDVVLQIRILKEDFLRWIMHMCIYGGFIMLLLMHALGKIISTSLFTDYYSTLNPFFFLRDFFGFLMVIGICIAFFRRIIIKIPRLKTGPMDLYAIILLAVILFSGILLEGAKITSHKAFLRMVEDYSDTHEEEELKALETLWIEKFCLSSSSLQAPFEEETLERGMEIHEMNCAGCHSPPQYAFMGYQVASLIRTSSEMIDKKGVDVFLYYFHVIVCFFGLAYLPFSKMFHIFATPLSLLSNSVMHKGISERNNIATRQVMELDACTHCGTCNLYCSAMMAHKVIGNDYILPSEKMQYLKSMVLNRKSDPEEIRAIQEGVHLCTNCDRCTVVCPSGINLKDMWLNVREILLQKGLSEPLLLSQFSLVRGLNRSEFDNNLYIEPLERIRSDIRRDFDEFIDSKKTLFLPVEIKNKKEFEIEGTTFSYCFGCQTCTTVCPVVDNFNNPQYSLGLLPHQIMCCLGLGLVEIASGPNMLWDCVTCYKCQEHCPQNVKVTDILYDLKNMAIRNLRK